jgi:hypothetical protein
MFKSKKESLFHKPVPRGFYAFNAQRAGDFLLFVEMFSECYKFVYLPGGDLFYLSFEDFTKAIKTNLLSFVEQLPEDIYEESLSLSCPSNP